MGHLLAYPGHELLIEDIVRVEEGRLVDASGRRYVDLEAGVWCAVLGHGHPAVLAAIADQAGRIAHAGFNYAVPVVADTVRDLLGRAGFPDGRGTLLCSGSEAVEYCVRSVQSVATRPLMLTMADSYFGAYGVAHRKQPDECHLFDWQACVDCPRDGGCGAGCPHWDTIPFDRIGGFLFEPGSSGGLVRFPPIAPVRAMAAAVRERGGMVVVNEVTTGLGRTGAWFGFHHYHLQPDAVALGKGLGNGYPVSAALLGPRLVEGMGGQPLRYAQSHQNDPLGAAVAATVLRVIDEEALIENGRALGDGLVAGLQGVAERTGSIREIRARGPMIAVEFQADAMASSTGAVHRDLARRGFLVGRRPGVPVLRLDPPLNLTWRDASDFLTAFEESLCARGSC